MYYDTQTFQNVLDGKGSGKDAGERFIAEVYNEPAAGGTASTPTLNSLRYLPRPGFVGHDRFVIERTAEGMARHVLRGTAHRTVEIDVVP